MKKYNIFLVKKEIYSIYKDNQKSLFKTLFNLKNMSKCDLSLGLSIYNEICDPINKQKITKYINLLKITRQVKNKYLINKNIIIIKPSRIILRNEQIDNDIIYILKNYSKYLFMCDFENKEYYWLNEL